ncbi:high affinity nitrate transporter 2.5-like [Chenopodium quinoa]|uniref:Major facilitator superfamily (MFS) profile domain-containing protein n=1 Tax=Chenopodium quinoa TaxID=63459 RepID=A0A803KWV1_CHEQI|nr:high affinity nitrate transporter 2.5-like [Chenopodium quinoa]
MSDLMPTLNGVDEIETKKFALPVDAENKATVFPLVSVAKPHMRAFHLCWIQFFSCFLSTFAAPPLLPIIRDNLNLTQNDIGNAGVGSVSGAIFARVLMGTACDLFGPRLASATLTLLTAPAVYLSAVADSAPGFFAMRFFTGFALATFVSTQYWMSSMFSPTVVGLANGQSAGWGNLGGGVAQLVMPLVYTAILKTGATNFVAWRIAFFIPALFQMSSAFAVMLLGQDLPDGNFHQLQKSGNMHKDNAKKVLYHGISNYRSWITALGYGFCFGVELAVNNIVAYYFYDRFNLNLNLSGIVAATFGMVNLFSRPIGGGLSDFMAKKYGMRGRLWSWWIVQTISGVLCIALGLIDTLAASIAVMIIFSLFVQAAEGLTFGVVPFVSRRSLGVVSGMTGAGGNVGAVLTQVIFFRGSQFTTERGITYMGVMIIACSLGIVSIYFPQWGGVFCSPKANFTEEDYYLKEWDAEEQKRGLHDVSMKFAGSCRNERSTKGKSVTKEAEMSAPDGV